MSYNAQILADSINPQGDRITTMKITFPRIMLAESGHWSPFEHVARAMSREEYLKFGIQTDLGGENGWCRNFRGFIQYRHLIEK